jgi:hypothetical protein
MGHHYGVKIAYFDHREPVVLGSGDHLSAILHKGLDNLGCLYKWVSSGTILGLHRDGDFIESDSDIDVGVLGGLDKAGTVAAMEPWELIREVIFDGQVQQLIFRTEENVLFDVTCWYMDGEMLVTHAAHKLIMKPARLVIPFRWWKGSPAGDIPAPNDLDAYCEMRYGANWRTPTPSKGIYGWENERKQAAAGGSA